MINVHELTFMDGDEDITKLIDVHEGCGQFCEAFVDACVARGITIMYKGQDITFRGNEFEVECDGSCMTDDTII